MQFVGVLLALGSSHFQCVFQAYRRKPSPPSRQVGVVIDDDMDEATKPTWTGCIAGALNETELAQALTTAGLTQVEIRPTHRVHTHVQAAIIRALR